MRKQIVLTEHDHQRLSQILDLDHSFGDQKSGNCLKQLNQDLENAKIVASSEIPSDIITMNSKIVLRDEGDKSTEEWILCFPQSADIYENKISVLSPMGIELLGSKKDDIIEWDTPRGRSRAKVESIAYQPEASGDYHL